MTFRIGCAIWAYKPWVGELFPAGSRATDFLHLYSRRFTTVEGNTTFYSIPDHATVNRWASETPAGFKFCLKLPRDITHQGTLANRLPAAIAFLDKMMGLGDRLGPLFVQLPPSYSPQYLDDLTTFLQGWPSDRAQLVVEVRHPEWFREPYGDRLNTLLQQLGMGRVLLDTRPIYECPDDPQLQSERRKPQVPLHQVVTSDFCLIRYISHPDLSFNQPYLLEWVASVEQWLRQGKQVYFFVHCPIEERSPATARYVQHLLEQQSVPVPPLPWDGIQTVGDRAPAQLSLFE